MQRRIAAGCLAIVGIAGAACRLFELGDVVPVADASADGNDIGDGGLDGADGAACVSADPCKCLPTPTTIVKGLLGTGEAIALAGPDVYFMVSDGTAGNNPAIYRAPIASPGAQPVKVMNSSPVFPSMVIGGSSLFMRKVGTGLSVLRVPLDAVAAAPTVVVGPLPFVPTDLAADAKRIYWPNATGAICAAPLDGTPPPPDTVDSGCGGAPVVAPRDGGYSTYSQIVISSNEIFWTLSGSKILTAPADVGAPVQQIVFQPGGNVTALSESSGDLLWINVGADAGSLFRADHDGGRMSVLVGALIDRSVAPAYVVDADGIYWGHRNWDRLMAASRDGSRRALLACEEQGVVAIATDQTHVYWVTGNGAVQRVAKK
jgi:hypothetical protein